MAEVKLSKWGNSSGIRFPKEILIQVGFEVGSIIDVEVVDNQLVLRKANKKQSIHDLFKDYKDGSFKSELADVEPVGNELW